MFTEVTVLDDTFQTAQKSVPKPKTYHPKESGLLGRLSSKNPELT